MTTTFICKTAIANRKPMVALATTMTVNAAVVVAITVNARRHPIARPFARRFGGTTLVIHAGKLMDVEIIETNQTAQVAATTEYVVVAHVALPAKHAATTPAPRPVPAVRHAVLPVARTATIAVTADHASPSPVCVQAERPPTWEHTRAALARALMINTVSSRKEIRMRDNTNPVIFLLKIFDKRRNA